MKAVILAGGLGTRLRPVGEKSVMEIQSYGFDEIYLATNYKSQYYFGDGIKLEISKETKRLGTAGPLKDVF